MKKAFLIMILMLVTAVAQAGSITCSFVNEAAQQRDFGKSFQADKETRFLAWLKDGPHAYWPLDVDGNPLPDTQANYAQAYDNWINTFLLSSWSGIKRWEEDEAAQAGRDGVPDMTFD